MADFQINSAATPPATIQAVRQVESPKPPKSQSDHQPLNSATSSRGPAVVLSGAFAQPTDKQGQQQGQSSGQGQGQNPSQGQPQPPQAGATGQRINHVI